MDNMVTIPKDRDDPFYRYKRNKIQASTISKNGGTTILHNIKIISEQIYRTINDLKLIFTKSLKTIVKINHDKIHIKGIYSVEILESVLENFINRNVICKICGNPETVNKSKSIINSNKKHNNQNIYYCQACGNKQ